MLLRRFSNVLTGLVRIRFETTANRHRNRFHSRSFFNDEQVVFSSSPRIKRRCLSAGRLLATHRVRTYKRCVRCVFAKTMGFPCTVPVVVEKFEIIPYIFRKRTSGFRRRVRPTTDRTSVSCPRPNVVVRTLIDVIILCSYSIHRSRSDPTRPVEKVTIRRGNVEIRCRKPERYVASLTAQFTISSDSYLGRASP